jgi:ABC transporter substrate binding protein
MELLCLSYWHTTLAQQDRRHHLGMPGRHHRNSIDQLRRAAAYIDRILRGAKPADLPVQLPVKFDMVLNARTAKALGLTVPPSILLRADEVIDE